MLFRSAGVPKNPNNTCFMSQWKFALKASIAYACERHLAFSTSESRGVNTSPLLIDQCSTASFYVLGEATNANRQMLGSQSRTKLVRFDEVTLLPVKARDLC